MRGHISYFSSELKQRDYAPLSGFELYSRWVPLKLNHNAVTTIANVCKKVWKKKHKHIFNEIVSPAFYFHSCLNKNLINGPFFPMDRETIENPIRNSEILKSQNWKSSEKATEIE